MANIVYNWGNMRHTRSKNLFSKTQKGFILILVGFIFFALAGFLRGAWEYSSEVLLPSDVPKYIDKIEGSDLPERIIIPKVKIDLSVFPGKVIEEKWEIAQQGVSYLLGTGIPGRVGNVVVYGHNKRNQFGPIRWLEKEDEIKIINGKGEEFIYKVKETKIVSPNQIEVLRPTHDSTLTLYTCTGILDRQRFVVLAFLSSGR